MPFNLRVDLHGEAASHINRGIATVDFESRPCTNSPDDGAPSSLLTGASRNISFFVFVVRDHFSKLFCRLAVAIPGCDSTLFRFSVCEIGKICHHGLWVPARTRTPATNFNVFVSYFVILFRQPVHILSYFVLRCPSRALLPLLSPLSRFTVQNMVATFEMDAMMSLELLAFNRGR